MKQNPVLCLLFLSKYAHKNFENTDSTYSINKAESYSSQNINYT